MFHRYTAWLITLGMAVLGAALGLAGNPAWWVLMALGTGLFAIGLIDRLQTAHAIRRNYPLIGNLRFLLEYVRPEIRQYFIEGDTDEKPFSRQQRSLVYQRAKQESDKRPFGSIKAVYEPAHEWINHSILPAPIATEPFRVRVGGERCRQPYEASVFNISAMSFGALSANAILALNGGARKGGFAHDTGEGSISRYHRSPGGDLIWEIGSGYFGCRDAQGRFDEAAFVRNATDPQVKMIELKLSQGAKPGHGGILPGSKVTPEIAEARGVEPWTDCNSPAAHSAFDSPAGLLQFLDRLRDLSGGKPVGFKFCVGHVWEWFAIVRAMLDTGLTPDFIVIDGAEGGTGAAPVEFADHVGMPLQEGLLLVHNTLVGAGLRDRIRLGASGKIISAFDIARTLALGADFCNSARGFMFALGCIQAQSCHTGTCPTGVATQDPSRQKALVVPDKTERVYHFHRNTVKALAELVAAAGLQGPDELTASHVMRRLSPQVVKSYAELFSFLTPGVLLQPGASLPEPWATLWPRARSDRFSVAEGVVASFAAGAHATKGRAHLGQVA